MRARSAWFVLAAILFSLSSRAHAAVSVFGTPEAVECFEKAEAGSSDTKACDDALENSDLLGRDRASTLVNRGIIYNNARKMNLALADFAAALAMNPNIAEAYLNRGNSKFLQGKLDEAIADYTHALDLKIDRAGAAYYDRALAYVAQKRLKEAKADLEAALAEEEDFKEAKDELAAVNAALASNAKAPPASATPR
ncbi:MAG: tetratricopeptide repeat protein [Alphaproteobacteria bacterium]